MYLRISSVAHVRAGHDELRVDYFCGPFLLGICPGTRETRPLLFSNSPIVLREVVDDAVRRRAGPRCGINISFEYG